MQITHKLPRDKEKDWLLIAKHHLADAYRWEKDLKLTIEPFPESGNWSLTRLWRSWMASTAEFMALNGVTMPLMINKDGKQYGSRPFNHDDAHELFTAQWLGVDAQGNRLSWAKSGDNIADKGQRFNAMQKHEAYMVERGIKHMIPRESEYFTEKENQNA